MNSFAEDAAASAAYFSAVAQVSGALVGLVFVALTFNPKALGADGHPALRSLARQTFDDFLLVLVASLLLLIPHIPPHGVGASLIALSGRGDLRLIQDFRRNRERSWWMAQRIGLSLFGQSGVLVAGAMLLYPGFSPSTLWLTLNCSVLVLLLAGSRTAWLLLVGSPD